MMLGTTNIKVYGMFSMRMENISYRAACTKSLPDDEHKILEKCGRQELN